MLSPMKVYFKKFRRALDASGAKFGVLFGVVPIKGRVMTSDLSFITMGPIKVARGIKHKQ